MRWWRWSTASATASARTAAPCATPCPSCSGPTCRSTPRAADRQIGRLPAPEVPRHHPEVHHRPGLDGPAPVGDGRAVEEPRGGAVGRGDRTGPLVVVELRHPTADDPTVGLVHETIFEIGSSMMSEAPASRSAGISVLMPSLATTVSTA